MKNVTQTIYGLLLMSALVSSDSGADDRDGAKEQSMVEIQRKLAKEAVESATREAVAAVLEDTRLDLDIRLLGPTSVTIAGDS